MAETYHGDSLARVRDGLSILAQHGATSVTAASDTIFAWGDDGAACVPADDFDEPMPDWHGAVEDDEAMVAWLVRRHPNMPKNDLRRLFALGWLAEEERWVFEL